MRRSWSTRAVASRKEKIPQKINAVYATKALQLTPVSGMKASSSENPRQHECNLFYLEDGGSKCMYTEPRRVTF
jgi:hypothetical protein